MPQFLPNLFHRYADLPTNFYTLVDPQPLESSRWLIWNKELAEQIGISVSPPSGALKDFLSGEGEYQKTPILAMKYAGHQFGVYNPDLGDGRGLLLGEIQSLTGQMFDVHLKGAGKTPYSRMGDGRAVLRSTIREYLCSEAMVGLGIPTTRALGILVSDSPVYREKVESGAMLLRIAESHIRFGHFEHFFYTKQFSALQLLADKVIEWYWPECLITDSPYTTMFAKIVEKTAEMIAYWQAYGFAHGVMNTDNMSILGLTFDYGPYGFLDDYDPSYICNHSDYQGRYAFDQQPRIALWNLSALAHSLSPLIAASSLERELNEFESKLSQKFSQLMRKKLGLLTKLEQDSELFSSMYELLRQNQVDYTRFLRELSSLDTQPQRCVADLFVDREAVNVWLERYLERCEYEVGDDGQPISVKSRCQGMRKANPKYILRNYLAQIAIDKAELGDFSEVIKLAELLKRPFDEQPMNDAYANLPPDWGKKMEISCSS